MGLSMRNVAIGALLLLGGMAIAFLLMTPYLTLVRSRGSCADLSPIPACACMTKYGVIVAGLAVAVVAAQCPVSARLQCALTGSLLLNVFEATLHEAH